MESNDKARDPLELEGTLLPTAEPVVGDDDEQVPAAVVFDYDQKQPVTEIILDAPTVPTHVTSHDPEQDKRLLERGARNGLFDADAEIDAIQRNNRDTYAHQYNAKAQLQQANKHAASIQRKEDTGAVQTTDTMPQDNFVPPPVEKLPEFYPGTYGKGYEVAEYDTKKYDTSEYNVAKYKSVYES